MLYIRLGIGLMMILCALEVLRVMWTLKNRELIMISRRIGISIGAFALLRIIAGFVDEFFAFAFPYFSTASTYAFWIATYAFFWHHRRILQSDEVGAVGRAKINRSVDDIATEMRRFSNKLDRVLK